MASKQRVNPLVHQELISSSHSVDPRDEEKASSYDFLSYDEDKFDMTFKGT